VSGEDASKLAIVFKQAMAADKTVEFQNADWVQSLLAQRIVAPLFLLQRTVNLGINRAALPQGY